MTVWERRDLPVLQALATRDDEHVRHGVLHLTDRGGATGNPLDWPCPPARSVLDAEKAR
jgi:hypothetical protein